MTDAARNVGFQRVGRHPYYRFLLKAPSQIGLETRLVRRPNGTYSFRAWEPPELREVIPGGLSGQKWIALGTADWAEVARRAQLRWTERNTDEDFLRADRM